MPAGASPADATTAARCWRASEIPHHTEPAQIGDVTDRAAPLHAIVEFMFLYLATFSLADTLCGVRPVKNSDF